MLVSFGKVVVVVAFCCDFERTGLTDLDLTSGISRPVSWRMERVQQTGVGAGCLTGSELRKKMGRREGGHVDVLSFAHKSPNAADCTRTNQ